MISVFLPPFPFRGDNAPYLWFFYKILSKNKNEKMNFIFSEDYLNAHQSNHRWELDLETADFLGYEIPTQETLSKHIYHYISENIYENILKDNHRNPTAAFKAFITTRQDSLEEDLDKILNLDSLLDSEAIYTPVNCASLTAVADKYGIPVVHIELGPLRAPHYLRTAYFDFSGVNGNTEAKARYEGLEAGFGTLQSSLEELRNFFLWDSSIVQEALGRHNGIPLQVEDDSNLVSYSNGFDNASLLTYALQNTENPLIRHHPKSEFILRQHDAELDNSATSIDFILKCERITTINSSVGLEAMLFGVSVDVLGDSSFTFIAEKHTEPDHLNRLGFYLFGYLAPYEVAFDLDYLRFRLHKPTEQTIIRRHFAAYGYDVEESSKMAQLIDNGIKLSRMDLFKRREINIRNTLLTLQSSNKDLAAENELLRIENLRILEALKISEQKYNNQTLSDLNTIQQLRSQACTFEQQVQLLQASSSWRITEPLRILKTDFTPASQKATSFLRKLKYIVSTVRQNPEVLLRTLKRLKTKGLADTINHSVRAVEHNNAPATADIRISKTETTKILVVPHCTYIGELIQHQLKRAGFTSEIIYEMPNGGFDSSLHFVVCPQIFKVLPGLYVAMQMEQSVSDRWFDDRYIKILENSFAIFDYSIKNVSYLQEKGLSHKQIHFMPIDYMPAVNARKAPSTEYDVVFYGDANNDRRRAYLDRIKSSFKTKVINNIFGEELRHELSKGKVVVNIHYYEGALLETCRVYECLAHDLLVISESSSDIEAHQRLEGLVDFVDIGDIDQMIERIRHWTSNEEARINRINATKQSLNNIPNDFEFYFQRFLLSSDNIDFDKFYELAAKNVEFKTNYLCLGLPECVDRRKDFEKDNSFGFQYFPGLRHSIGWIGCGLSYKFIMRKAQELGFDEITVCEDDVEFLPGWKEKFDKVHAHLIQENVRWDIFSGLIADLHNDTEIKGIDKFEDFDLIHIDKMISAVLNTYNSKIFPLYNMWDSNHRDPYVNTIDKFIESQVDIDVVTTTPFLVGHKEELTSTLWGFKNTQYKEVIAASINLLGIKIQAYESRNKINEK
jgi:hypothetical protein